MITQNILTSFDVRAFVYPRCPFFYTDRESIFSLTFNGSLKKFIGSFPFFSQSLAGLDKKVNKQGNFVLGIPFYIAI